MQPQAEYRTAPDLVPVRIACIPSYWEEAWPLLEPAAARSGLHTKESVLAALMTGAWQLWVVEDDRMLLAVTTEIAEYPARSIASVELLGGERFDECLRLFPIIEAWAKECGCDRFVIHGRIGFAKKLKKYGYTLESVALVKDFHDA
jgi:hypothetical protein